MTSREVKVMSWSHYEEALEELREQQREDFLLVMVAMATTRDALARTQESLEQVEAGLVRHQKHNEMRLELIERAARSESSAVNSRLDRIEERLDRLEHPAA